MTKHPEYQTRNFYIFCESYGGKMSAAFAKTLQDSIDAGTIKVNLKGVALGDSWISAMDFVNTWGPYLHAVSYLDENQLAQAQTQAGKCQTLVNQGQWVDATNCWGDMENLVGTLTNGVSWYNILKEGGQDTWSVSMKKYNSLKYLKKRTPLQTLFDNHVAPLQLDALTDFMNGPIRKKLGIIPNKVSFGAQSGRVFDEQAGDFMTPNYATVDNLLSRGVFVNVYVGQLDLICDVLGTEMWMDRLTWTDYATFKNSPRTSFSVQNWDNNFVDGFVKSYKNLQMWYILRGGHMVAHDSPWAALHVMQSIVQKP
jgi:serine carboxypeptidase 1